MDSNQFLDFVDQQSAAVKSMAVGSVDANPDQAARAVQLGSATGVPAEAINDNIDQFETQHKAALTGQIIDGNEHLQDYVQSDPMAAKVSNDDWAGLDAVSSSGNWLAKFKSAVGNYIGEERQEAQGAIEQGGKAQDQIIQGLHEAAQGQPSALKDIGLGALSDLMALGSYVYSPIGAGVHQIVSQPFGQAAQALTGSERLGQSVSGAIDQTVAAFLPMGHAAEPWTSAGMEPPAGIHPDIDKIKGEVNAKGVEELENQLAAAQASTTKERSPEMFRQFVAQQHGDTTIGISGDAATALYGDKLPEPGDGLLGFVPDMADQLALAKETGQDVHVPIADWLTYVDPAVAQGLHDDIRIWPGGVTAREATVADVAKPSIDSPLAQTRGAFGMEPMFAFGDRKLTLVRTDLEPVTPEGLSAAFGHDWDLLSQQDKDYYTEQAKVYSMYHDHEIHDADGKVVGNLTLTPDVQNKRLIVNMVGGEAGMWSNSFGTSLVLDLKRQLKSLYPDYNTITGHRVTGAREKANTSGQAHAFPEVKLSAPDISSDDYNNFKGILNDAYWHQISPWVTANIRPTGLYSDNEVAIIRTIHEEAQRVLGSSARIFPADEIRYQGLTNGLGEAVNPLGVFQPYKNDAPVILYNILHPDQLGIARHEFTHALRRMMPKDKWNILQDAAENEGWMDKYDINERYSPDKFTEDQRIEEAIADARSEWEGNKDTEAFSQPVKGVFAQIKQWMDNVKARVTALFGREPTWQELFQQMQEGKFAQQEGFPSGGTLRAAFALPEDMEAVTAKAMGLDLGSYKKLQKAVQARYEADLAAAQARAERNQKRLQTQEWKSNAAEIRAQVKTQILQRPDVAADQFIAMKSLYGQRIAEVTKLREEDLTPEQRAALPNHYVSKNGLPVDGVASLFGYPSGDAMIEHLAALHAQTKDMSATERLEAITKAETDRQMQAKFGSLGENIMSEARDQALSETDLNLMAEELQAAGMKAGQAPVDVDQIKAFAAEGFGKQKIGDIDTQRLLTTVGKHGRDAERNLIAGKLADAVVSLQRKYLSAVIAKAAAKLDKEKAGFAKLTKSMARKEIKTIDPEYHDWINQIMQQVGLKTQRMPWDIANEIAAHGKTLAEFAQDRNDTFARQLQVPEFLADPKFKQPLATLTVDQFRDLNNFIKSLVDNGRDERKINVKGEAMDLANYKKSVINEINQSRTVKEYNVNGGRWKNPVASKLESLRAGIVAAHINVVDLMDRFDHYDSNGLWSNGPIRDLVRGAQERDRMIKQYSKQLLDADDGADLKKTMDNPIFRAPEEFGGHLIQGFTRKNLRAVMLNVGTNLRELAGGYGLKPDDVMNWIHANATREDWAWTQKVWKTFAGVKGEGDTMYRSIGSHGIGEVPALKIQTPFGEVEGGYYPLVRDEIYGGQPKAVREAVLNSDYVRYTPPAGYTQTRTKAVYPLSLTTDALPNRLMQEIHDISMRPALINAIKVFLDKDIQATISSHFGKEVGGLLKPYIADLANTSNRMSSVQAEMNSLLGGIRQNLITSLVGVGTFAKHTPTAYVNSIREVGFVRFHQELFTMFSRDEATGDRAVTFAMNNSNELPRRGFNSDETVYGAHQILVNKSRAWSLQQMVKAVASKPLQLGDLLSAIPLWLARYKMAVEAGESHGDAVYLADRAVQHAHGSTLITNRPAVVRDTNPWFTSLYNFYSNMVNRHMEAVWKAGERVGATNSPYETHAQKVKDIAGMTFAYAVWPAIIEQMVSPIGNQDDSWTKKAAEAMTQQFASGWIGLRDVAGYFIRGEDPGFGLLGTGLKFGGQIVKDISAAVQKGNNPIRDRAIINSGINAAGMFTGMVPGPIGDLAKYVAGVQLHQEHPRSAWDWLSGIQHGTSRPRPRR